MNTFLSRLSFIAVAVFGFQLFSLPAMAQEAQYFNPEMNYREVNYVQPSDDMYYIDPDAETEPFEENFDFTISPAMKQIIIESVKSGELPKKNAMKGLSEDEKQEIIDEIERILAEREAAQAGQERPNGTIQNIFSEYWVQFLALVVSLVGVILAVSGFSLANSKKRKHISKYMNEIDDAFNSFKWKSKRCEAELYRLHDIIEEKLKEGKLDESSYQLLSNRIEKYLKEVQDVDGIPNNIKKLSKEIDAAEEKA